MDQATERVAVAEEARGAEQAQESQQPQSTQSRHHRDHRRQVDELHRSQEETEPSREVGSDALRDRLLEHVELWGVVGEDAQRQLDREEKQHEEIDAARDGLQPGPVVALRDGLQRQDGEREQDEEVHDPLDHAVHARLRPMKGRLQRVPHLGRDT